jgi:hypothetical protein
LTYSLVVVIQTFLGGLFMYLFLRVSIRLGRFGSLLGAVVFMFNGVFMVWLEFWSTPGGGIWFPLVFLFVERTLSKMSLPYAGLAAIFLAIQIFAGNLQFSIYLLLATFVYSLKLTWQHKKDGLRETLRLIGLSLIILSLGISLSSIHLLPFYQQASMSHRVDKKVRFEELNPLPVANLATFLIPDFYGTPAPPHTYRQIRSWFYNTGLIKERTIKVGGENYNEYCGYIGILPLILALLAGFLQRDGNTRFFFWFWIVSLLLALGTPLYLPLYYFAPGFSSMGISRIIFLFCFSGSVLSGIGAEYLRDVGTQGSGLAKGGLVIRVVIWVLCIASLIWLIFLLLPKFNTQSTIRNPQLELLSWHFSLRNPSMTIPIVLGLSSAFVLLQVIKGKAGGFLFRGIVLFVVSFDLLYFGMRYNPMTPKEWLFPKTPSINFLTEKLGNEPPFRVIAFGRILPPNTNIVYRLQCIEGYESLHSKRYQEFINELVSPDVCHNWIDVGGRIKDRRFLDLLNVKYILLLGKLNAEGLELVYDNEIQIYQNKRVFPRAWIVPQAMFLSGRDRIFSKLKNPEFNLKRCVVLETKVGMCQTKKIKEGSFGASIEFPTPEIMRYEPDEVAISARLPQPGYLVLSDTWHPGWRVWVDGEEGEVLCANYIMRAVHLDKGCHKVLFRYEPIYFKLGLGISILSFATITLLCIAFPLYIKNRNRRGSLKSVT